MLSITNVQKVKRCDYFAGSKSAPVAKAGTFGGQQRGLVRRLGLLGQPEEGVVLHAGFPEGLAHVTSGHAELQRVLAGRLKCS